MSRDNILKYYDYIDYDDEKIKTIAEIEIKYVKYKDAYILIQALFPKNIIGSGLFGAFLVFEIKDDGKPVDPPKDFYNNFSSKSRNSKEKSAKCLLRMIIELFESKSIIPHQSWIDQLKMYEVQS